MSIDALRWAWTIQGVSSSEKLVLLSFADRAGENHTCYPSIERLSLDTCLNRKTVISTIGSLIKKGIVQDTGENVGRTKQVKKYKLVGVPLRENMQTVPKAEQYRKRNSTESGTVPKMEQVNSTDFTTLEGVNSTDFGTQNPKSFINPNSINPKREREWEYTPSIESILSNFPLSERVKESQIEFDTYLRQKGTHRIDMQIAKAVKLLIEHIEKYGEEAMIKRTDEAIAKGWGSIPAPDGKYSNGNTKKGFQEEDSSILDEMLGGKK